MAATKSRGGKKHGAAQEVGGKQHLGVRTRTAAGKRVQGQNNRNTTKARKR